AVAEHPVEPRGDALLGLERHLVEATGERLLEEVLGGLAVSHPALQEGEERASVLGHRRQELFAGRGRHGGESRPWRRSGPCSSRRSRTTGSSPSRPALPGAGWGCSPGRTPDRGPPGSSSEASPRAAGRDASDDEPGGPRTGVTWTT